MSLQVGDPRSRGRSKSPSGRIRDRSRSRDPLASSPAVEATRQATRSSLGPGPDHADHRSHSRSRGASRGHYRTGSRYDDDLSVSDSDHEPRRDSRYLRTVDPVEDRYYLSDSGSKAPAPASARMHRSSDLRSPNLRPVRKYESESEDSSEDEALAYGDVPDDLERAYYGYTGTSSSRVDSARPGDAQAPGSHPSYARPDSYKYATPSQYLHTQQQPGYSGPPPTSGAAATWAPIPDCERPGYVPPSSQAQAQAQAQSAMPGAFPTSTGPESAAAPFPMPQYMSAEGQANPYTAWANVPTSGAYVPTSGAYAPPVSGPPMSGHQRTASSDAPSQLAYANVAPFQYAQVDPKVKYGSKSASAQQMPYAAAPGYPRPGERDTKYQNVKYSANPQFSKPPPQPSTRAPAPDPGPQYVEITPGRRTTRPPSLPMSMANNLSVEGPDPSFRPASPMQEPYKGTYQSISPMPSPIVAPARFDEDVSDLEPLDGASDMEGRRKHRRKKSKDERERKDKKTDRVKRDSSRVRQHERHTSSSSQVNVPGPESLMLISPSATRKRVSFYDPTPDAIVMQEALGSRTVDHKALTRVLPHLTSDEIQDLRKEYKNHVKLRGKGINLAKHLHVKLGNNSFGKVCYATALGRWESEAYWANCYYQSSTSRRELLIESLFGRSSDDIRAIKDCFRDSRYMNSLEKCMKAELKADKFRNAVLLALEETRQNERDPIDPARVERDVHELHRALISRNGGESAMISIIVRRSDSHLREVLRAYEQIYQRNFARAMIAKSQNLVGETLAHILNGVINRPMRDALLLHQALRESKTGKERSELLISRLVRFHWEPRHLELVKQEFRRRYGQRLEEAIAEEILPTTGGAEWGEFCIELARSSKTMGGR